MKNMKKILALVVAVLMIVASMSVAFADDTPSITIKNTNSNISINGKTYSAYKLFDSTHTGTAYAYTMSTSNQFYSADLVTGTPAEGSLAALLKTYFTFTAVSGDTSKVNVTPKDSFTSESDARAFADKIQKFLTGKTATATSPAAANEQAVIDLSIAGAGLGYYIVTGNAVASAEGDNTEIVSAVILTNEDPNPEVKPKADAPSVDKKITKIAGGTAKVEEGGKEGNGSVGDKVEYELTSKVPDMTGYKSYAFVYTDTMTSGLTFNDDIAITIDGNNYTAFTKEATTDSETGVTTIKITFNNFIEQAANKGKDIKITYSATINEKAAVTGKEDNTVHLEYSHNPYDDKLGTPDEVLGRTPDIKTTVYDTNIQLTKVNKDGKKLTGAKFKIEGNSNNVRMINSEMYEASETGTWYRLKDGTYTETAPNSATEDQYDGNTKYALVEHVTKETVTKTYTNEGWVKSDSTLTFNGLGEGTYTITELVSPEGYNLLTAPISVVITFDATTKKFTATVDTKNATVDNNVIKFDVENTTGTALPSTGGIGTTLFYIGGGILVLAAVILLVTKRRMNAND